MVKKLSRHWGGYIVSLNSEPKKRNISQRTAVLEHAAVPEQLGDRMAGAVKSKFILISTWLVVERETTTP